MAFSDQVKADVEATHELWERSDIIRTRRTVTARSVTGSTPTYTTAAVAITGIITVTDAMLLETIFGGVENCDALLLVKAAVDVAYNDLITHPDTNEQYRIEEIRTEEVAGVEHQRFCRLVKVDF